MIYIRLSSAEFLELLQDIGAHGFRDAIHFSMPMREASRLSLKGFHLLHREASEAQLSTGTGIALNHSVINRTLRAMGAHVAMNNAEQVSVDKVVHEQPKLRLRARSLRNAPVHLLQRAHFRRLAG